MLIQSAFPFMGACFNVIFNPRGAVIEAHLSDAWSDEYGEFAFDFYHYDKVLTHNFLTLMDNKHIPESARTAEYVYAYYDNIATGEWEVRLECYDDGDEWVEYL